MSTAVVQSESGAATTAAGARASGWIISPLWDLVLLIAAPLAIVPLVSLSATHLVDVEELSLVVISFATLGHHLPGFLRAYGDRELFSRYRHRFVWGPPLVLGVALVSAAYGLHGLALVLLFWATWHGLMQTYGFMRIYDLKQGTGDRHGARLDFSLCLVIFCAGLLMSDARVYGIADTIAKTGLPLPGPAWLAALRWAIGLAAVLVFAAYLVHLVGRFRRGAPLAWPRVALALSTGWLYWLGGVLATDMLIGIATFEIFHAIQYDAIVWAYNRGRARKTDALARPLGALFRQDRWASLGLYLAIIAAFSSIRLMGEVAGDSWVQRVLMALLTTSTFMHFYFDGFIWKVSDRRMHDGLAIADRAGLPDSPPGAAPLQPDHAAATFPAATFHTATPPALPSPALGWRPGHAVLCTALGVLVFGLLACEALRTHVRAGTDADALDALAALTPQLPELKWRISEDALARGDADRALDAAASAAVLRPHSQQAFARLGAAELAAGHMKEAAAALREATRLGPRRWNNHCNLGIALGNLGQWDEAEQAFRRAAALQPEKAAVEAAWARMCERRHDDREAAEHFRAALAADPQDDEARAALVRLLSRTAEHDAAVGLARRGVALHQGAPAAELSLGKALVAAGRYDEAASVLERVRAKTAAGAVDPRTVAMAGPAAVMAMLGPVAEDRQLEAAACYELAVVQLQLGQLDPAERNLDRVLRLDAASGLGHFQLGNLRHARGDLPGALAAYRRSIDLAPDFAPALGNLATVLLQTGDAAHARRAYERALALAPDNGSTHYNLGLLLLDQQQRAGAERHLLRARELGIVLPPGLEAQLPSRAAP